LLSLLASDEQGLVICHDTGSSLFQAID